MKKVRDSIGMEGVRELLIVATCAALVCGSVSAWCDVVQIELLHRIRWVSEDVVWMAPLAYLLLFIPVALLLALVSLLVGRRISLGLSVGIFAGLTAFSWLIPFDAIARIASLVLAVGIGAQVGRLASRRPDAWTRVLRRSAAALAVLAMVVGVGEHVWRRVAERAAIASLPADSAGRTSVLLVVFDTVRRANLSLYGYSRPTSPRLEAIAKEATVFDAAFSAAPWTLPSHASLMTGLPAESTGADWSRAMSTTPRTLAEVFRRHGYLTGGFVGNLTYTSYESGLARGFVHYDDYPITLRLVTLHSSLGRTQTAKALAAATSVKDVAKALLRGGVGRLVLAAGAYRPASSVTDSFLAWQARNSRHPYFAFINYFDAHEPYRPPPEYLRAVHGATKPEDRYDGAIAYLDHELGRIVDTLRARGQLAHTLVVVVADHGEQFGEHHLKSHANSLYLPLLRVPLVLVGGPAVAGRRVTAAVSLRDVAATLLDLAGVRDDTLPGRSLSRFWSGAPAPAPELLTATLAKGINVDTAWPNARGPMIARLDDSLHYIRTDGRRTEELYAWRTDSAELANLVRDSALAARLARLKSGTPAPR